MLPPPGADRERPLPDRRRPGAARRPHLRLDADRRARLARRRRARAAGGRGGRTTPSRPSSASSARIERNDRIRLPLTVLVGAIAYIAAVFVPRLAPRVFLLALAANLWLAGWWVVALVGLAAALLPLGVACATVLAAYLLVLGLDPEAVALSPFGPTQAGRFYGVTNLLATFLLVPALLGAALLGRAGSPSRRRGRRRRRQPVRCRRRRPPRAARRVRDAGRSGRAAFASTPGGAALAVAAVAVAGSRSSASTRRSAVRATSRTRSPTGRARSSATSPTGSSSPREGRSRGSGRRSPRWRRLRCCLRRDATPEASGDGRAARRRSPSRSSSTTPRATSSASARSPRSFSAGSRTPLLATPAGTWIDSARCAGRSPPSRSCSRRSRSSAPGAAKARSGATPETVEGTIPEETTGRRTRISRRSS